jgi:hypothetical protein
VPWGEACKSRCANAPLLLDADSSASTGLQLTQGAPENGADLAVIVQGVREWKEQGADTFPRVKVRQLADGARTVEDGALLVEMDHRQDPERVQADGETVLLRVDTTSAPLPSGRKARVVYHPAGGKAVQASIKGMSTGPVGGGRGGKRQVVTGRQLPPPTSRAFPPTRGVLAAQRPGGREVP